LDGARNGDEVVPSNQYRLMTHITLHLKEINLGGFA